MEVAGLRISHLSGILMTTKIEIVLVLCKRFIGKCVLQYYDNKVLGACTLSEEMGFGV